MTVIIVLERKKVIRFVILAVLLYIAYVVIFKKKKRNVPQGNNRPDELQEGPIEDVLLEDPVCHALVPKQQAVHLQHNGEMIYFCSEECCSRFLSQQGEVK